MRVHDVLVTVTHLMQSRNKEKKSDAGSMGVVEAAMRSVSMLYLKV